MTRRQWDLYHATRERFPMFVRVRTERDPHEAATWVFAEEDPWDDTAPLHFVLTGRHYVKVYVHDDAFSDVFDVPALVGDMLVEEYYASRGLR